jgi:hypothetical protein
VTERSPRSERVRYRAPATGRGPVSDVARDRLSASLSSEVAATRAAWTDALLRSDAALRSGRSDEARRALDDQRLLLAQLERRLDRAVASALVEREAERVVGSTMATDPATAGSYEPPAPAPDGPRWPRALTGAAAAVVVGVAALVLGSTPPPTPEIAAMTEDATGVEVDAVPDEVLVASSDPDVVVAPADELRHLSAPGPTSSAPAAQPEPAPPTDESAEQAPEETPEETRGEAAAAVSPPAEREHGAEDRSSGEIADDDAADEDDGGHDSLIERLPGVDRSVSDELGPRLDDLRNP